MLRMFTAWVCVEGERRRGAGVQRWDADVHGPPWAHAGDALGLTSLDLSF